MSFALTIMLKSIRYQWTRLLPWIISLGLASFSLLVLILVVKEAAFQRKAKGREHFFSIVGSDPSNVAGRSLTGVSRDRYEIREGTRSFTVIGVDFEQSNSLLPHLQLPDSTQGVAVGHAIFERLHLRGQKEIVLGGARFPISHRLEPMGTFEDDLLFMPKSLAVKLSHLPAETEWLVRGPWQKSEIEKFFPRGRIQTLDDVIYSERIFWETVLGIVSVMGVALVLLTLIFSYLSTVKLIIHRSNEFALWMALGLPLEGMRKKLGVEILALVIIVVLGTLVTCRVLWPVLVDWLPSQLQWHWIVWIVGSFPTVGISFLAVYLGLSRLSQQNLNVALQGGKEVVNA